MDNQLRFELLNNEYEIARSEAKKWELMVYEKYINGEQYLIMGMLALNVDLVNITTRNNTQIYGKMALRDGCLPKLYVDLNCLKSTYQSDLLYGK